MAIDIGSSPSNRASSTSVSGKTWLTNANPANANGTLNTFEIYMASSNAAGVKLGTFYLSGSKYYCRDYEIIGTVVYGSKQTFTGKDCSVLTGDYLGGYCSSGTIERDETSGITRYDYTGDATGGAGYSYTPSSNYELSLYATGISAAAVTTNTPTSIAATSLTANGNITATGGSGSDVTRRGFCYMEGDSGDPTTENSTVYDDGTFGTGAFTKSITGLSSSTNYRIRAYAVNAAGTAYGATVQAKTATLFLKDIMSPHFIPPFLGGR